MCTSENRSGDKTKQPRTCTVLVETLTLISAHIVTTICNYQFLPQESVNSRLHRHMNIHTHTYMHIINKKSLKELGVTKMPHVSDLRLGGYFYYLLTDLITLLLINFLPPSLPPFFHPLPSPPLPSFLLWSFTL